ncbi:MAG TPA: tRNA pseudouridine synthase A, partial [Thermomicrobiaceae bacterium]|nr:tRNA pseudouridine synthase A [Thermomicrobiaceae bacterium]
MSWHRRYRIQFGYDGTHFHGSQIQPGVRTVQGELEVAAGRITGHPVQFAFAGRTDRGVHALGQVASGDLSWRSTPEQLARALQAVTPDDIVVQRVTLVNDRFHARFSARSREYRYLIWTGPIPPILSRGWVWHIRRALDCPAMNAAGAMLLGEHDFASFAGDGLGVPGDPEKRSTVRRV